MADRGRGHDYRDISASGHSRLQVGDSYNTYNYYDSRSPSESRPSSRSRSSSRIRAKSTVPFAKDEHFVGRENILERLAIVFAQQGRHVKYALQGLGGIGKSQIAIEFSHRYRTAYPEQWVFWIHASTRSRFLQAYSEIADAMEIPGRKEPKVDILSLVRAWLSDEDNSRWLMIVDNADDGGIFFGRESEPLSSYIPPSSNGGVLFTSRNDTGRDLAGGPAYVMKIDNFDEETAVKLFRNRLPDFAVDDSTLELLKILDYIPLAINQAIAYIATTHITAGTYVDMFNSSKASQSYLLDLSWGDMRRDAKGSHAVLTTWTISFKQIQQSSSLATHALAMMSMFDRQGIPEKLIFEQSHLSPAQKEAIGLLLGYSLIQREAHSGITYAMHSLVQVCTKHWLEAQSKLEEWETKALSLMSTKFPGLRYKNRAECASLLPHARKTLEYHVKPSDITSVLARLMLMGLVGGYEFTQGHYTASKSLHECALKEAEERLGPDHIETLHAAANVASSLDSEGRFEEAEALDRRVLAGYQKEYGRGDLRTIHVVCSLATQMSNQGRDAEAEPLFKEVIGTMENSIGEDHRSTLDAVRCLAVLKSVQGEFKEAEKLYLRVISGLRKQHGHKDPDYLFALDNLALLHAQQGRLKDAEFLHKQVLKGRDTLLGPDHPNTLLTAHLLAKVYFRQENYADAQTLCQRALTGREKRLGFEHPKTVNSICFLAVIHSVQDNFQEAETLYAQALSIKEAQDGFEHPDTIQIANDLAMTYEHQARFEEAGQCYERILAAQDQNLGFIHRDTLSAVDLLIQCYLHQERQGTAAPLINRHACWKGLLKFLICTAYPNCRRGYSAVDMRAFQIVQPLISGLRRAVQDWRINR